MKIIKDLVPNDSTKLYRYAVLDNNGAETGEYINLGRACADTDTCQCSFV